MSCPPSHVSDSYVGSSSAINPSFLRWKQQDQFILSALLSSLSMDVLHLVVDCQTSHCVWCTLDQALISLQDFTVLPTEKFRRYVIRSSSVIFLPTSSPTEYVRRLYLRRWFPIPSVYQSEKQKKHLPTVLQTERARQKKKIPAWNIPTDFHSVDDVTITDEK
jgi:hypothetical protein